MKYYGQFKYPVDKYLHDKFFKDKELPGICMESGAVDGVRISSTKMFEESLGWKSINIEPHPESFKQLVKNRPDSININCALSDKKGELMLMYGKNHILRAHIVADGTVAVPNRHKFVVEKIVARTYTDIIDELNLVSLDLFVLDVEGHEIEVMRGMLGSKVIPDVLCVETNRTSRKEMENLTRDMGYEYHSEYRVNSFFVKK